MQQKIRSNLRRLTTAVVMSSLLRRFPTRCRRLRKAAGRAWGNPRTAYNVDLINFVQHEPNQVLRSDRTGRVRQSLMIRPQTRAFLAVAAVVASLVTGGCRRAPAEQSARRPNILVILLDDLRWDTLGYAGHPHVKTPQIDRIANEGVNFRNAFCTTSLCSPSRASLLSGVYAHTHGVTNNFTEFPTGMNSFPKMLQQVGYATAYVGKYHMGEGNDEPRPGVRLFRHPQGSGKVLRHRVQPQRRAARGEERLLHHRRHRHRADWVAARSQAAGHG